MQEHIYVAKRNRIISRSWLIWFFVAVQLAVNFFLLSLQLQSLHNQLTGIAFANILLGLITVPSIYIFMNYYQHSVGKSFIVTYNSLKLIDAINKNTIEMNSSDIKEIHLIQSIPWNRFPWSFHEYFIFIDNAGKKIIIPFYMMDISQFWLDSLTGKVSSNKLIRTRKLYPLI